MEKGRNKIKTITSCQQYSKQIMIQINVKNYCEMLLSDSRDLKKTLIEYTSVQLEFSKSWYKANP